LEKIPLNINLNRSILKSLLGRQLTLNDLADIDLKLLNSFQFLLDSHNSEALEMNHVYEYKDFFGVTVTDELKPYSSKAIITENTKKEYVKRFCERRMIKSIDDQLNAFKKGFRYILPRSVLGLYTPQDLHSMIAGNPNIDVEDMIKHFKIYGRENEMSENPNFRPEEPQYEYLCEILREFSQDQLVEFYHFITST
jgi:E3 ubiquitin-protein ligase HUWE1